MNRLKEQLSRGDRTIGFWASLGSPMAVEVIASAGFDWILIDAEHAPNELGDIIVQLKSVPENVEPVVRLPAAEPLAIKRLLDAGARSFLLPMIEEAGQAASIVAATRYPPAGNRGVSVAHRGNRFGRIRDYLTKASEMICIVAQIETRLAIRNIPHIAAVDGIDALFIGPSDLAADCGRLGNAGHPDVQAEIRRAINACRETNIAAGILAADPDDARRYLDWGASMVAVGSDLGVLIKATDSLRSQFADISEKD